MNAKIILVSVLASLAVVFLTQNVDVVEVQFLFWQVTMSRALLIFFCLLIGFIMGWFLHHYLIHRKAAAERKAEAEQSAAGGNTRGAGA